MSKPYSYVTTRIRELETLLGKCEGCFCGYRWDPDRLLPAIQLALYEPIETRYKGKSHGMDK